jgi:glycosyltransferase involved in cell wall biosynthesis
MAPWHAQSLSVVVPVFNEESNVRPLTRGVVDAVRPLGLPFELIIVDDGSTDRTPHALRELVPETPELIIIRLRRNFGQTLALQAGFDRARGNVIVTMDGDLQNDPSDIPRLIQGLSRGADVVSGWRRNRRDQLLRRRLPSWIANALIRMATGVPIHDQGCSLKAYRREVVQGLDLYGDMHRFVAILTIPLGASIAELEVNHPPRVSGKSKYGLWRIFRVLVDMVTIQMLIRFRENPIRWFALLGLPFLAGAVATALVVMWTGYVSIVLPTITVVSVGVFTSCILFGLLGEAIVQTGTRRGERRALPRQWGAQT